MEEVAHAKCYQKEPHSYFFCKALNNLVLQGN